MLIVVTDLGLSQIVPLEDDEGGEVEIIGASFASTHVLLLTKASTLRLFSADDSGELEEVTLGDRLAATKCLSSCIYKGRATNDESFIFILTAEGSLQVSH
jgi:cleavage and polyadenylation specificity factor subunit 1